MSDAFEKLLEGFTSEEVEEIRAKQTDWTYPAFVLSQGSDGETAVSIYLLPADGGEAFGDVLFRLPDMEHMKQLSTYLDLAIKAFEEDPDNE